MIRSTALGLVFLSVLAIGVAYASAFLPGGSPAWAPWSMSLGIAVLLPALMTLGAARHGRLGPLWLPFGFVFLVLAVGFGTALALPPADPADPALWLGLPPRAAVILLGVGLLPLLVIPVAYALTFDELGIREDDLARIRRLMTERADGAAPPPLRPDVDGREVAPVEVG